MAGLPNQQASVVAVAANGEFNRTYTGPLEWVGDYVGAWHEVKGSKDKTELFTIKGTPPDVAAQLGDVIETNNVNGETAVLTEASFQLGEIEVIRFANEI